MGPINNPIKPLKTSFSSYWDIQTQDCLNWLQTQVLGSFQGFILDPPYNVGYRYGVFQDHKPQHQYLFEQLLVLTHCQKLLKPGGSVFYLNYPEFAAELWARVDFLDKVDWLPWVYHSHTGGSPLRKGSRAWLWFSKGKPQVNPGAFKAEYRNPQDPRVRRLIQAGQRPQAYDWLSDEQVKNTSGQKRKHPCQVPQSQVERFIQACSQPGDQIGDCYLGSGTTALAALKLGRAFKGCELDPAYVRVAQEAIAIQQGQETLIRS